jgi:predicted CXXCH cytochrome family protein
VRAQLAALAIAVAGPLVGADEAGTIMRPVDGAALGVGPVDVVATARGGKLEMDGRPVVAEQPFPNVLHATTSPAPGAHTLVLSWEGGRKEIRIWVGPNPPAEFKPFQRHPPLEGVQCTQCHEMSKRGRFRFKGGCFDCHQQAAFPKSHRHEAGVLEQCGMCHNAHGSTVKGHLLYSRETACKQCHN